MLLVGIHFYLVHSKEKKRLALTKEKTMIIAKLIHNWSILFIFVEYIIKNK